MLSHYLQGNLVSRNATITNSRQKIINNSIIKLASQLLTLNLYPQMPQLFLQNLPTALNIFCPLLPLKSLPYLFLGMRCPDIAQMGIQPIQARPLSPLR